MFNTEISNEIYILLKKILLIKISRIDLYSKTEMIPYLLTKGLISIEKIKLFMLVLVIILSLLLTGCFSSLDNEDNDVVKITGNVIGDREYSVEGIKVSLSYEKEDGTGKFFAWTEVDENGQYQFVLENYKFPEGEMVYSIGFTPDRSKETYYINTSKDAEFNAQETNNFEVEKVDMEDGSLLHGVVKNPDGELMKEEWIKIRLEFETGVGGGEVKTNEYGEFYFGIKPRDNVDVEVTASDHDSYDNLIFKDIDFKHREKEKIEINF